MKNIFFLHLFHRQVERYCIVGMVSLVRACARVYVLCPLFCRFALVNKFYNLIYFSRTYFIMAIVSAIFVVFLLTINLYSYARFSKKSSENYFDPCDEFR